MKYLIHVYISPGRTRVSCTTAPCITWNCKNFCISLSPSSRSERLAAVVSYAHDTLMHKSTRLWWRKIYAVKSEKEIMEPCHCTKISSHLWQALFWLPFVKQRRTNSSLLETNVLHAPSSISKPMSPIILIEQFSIWLNYFFHFYWFL